MPETAGTCTKCGRVVNVVVIVGGAIVQWHDAPMGGQCSGSGAAPRGHI